MFAIPVVIVSPNKEAVFHQGLLHKLPPDLTGPQRINSYCRAKTAGWHTTEFGYHSYAIRNDVGDLYIFPALFLIDSNKPSKKFHGYKAIFSKTDIEGYANGIIERERNQRASILNELNSFVHDLRRLSGTIYHQAHKALNLIPNNLYQANKLIKSVIASQTMLKLRTDVLDISGTPISAKDPQHVPAYKRLDKVVQCFRPMAEERGISITLNGESHSFIFGPDVFEIICYIILDNAVKYSPNNENIEVNIQEDDGKIKIHIESIGPKISEHEYEEIFRKGFRGTAAINSNVAGSGLGLHLAKSLVKYFKGEIRFSEIEEINRLITPQMARHYFTIEVPISGSRQF